MRTRPIVAITLLCCAAQAQPAPDAGGVAFDWPPAGIFRLERDADAQNLVAGGDAEPDWDALSDLGWSRGEWRGNDLLGGTRQEVLDGIGRDDSRAFEVTIEPGADAVISSYVSVTVPVEDVRGLRVSMWNRAGDPPPGNGASVTFYPLRGEGWNMTGSAVKRFFTPGADWQQSSVEFVAPEETERVYVQFGQRGPGQFILDDVQAVRFSPDPQVRLSPFTTGPLDGVVALCPGEALISDLWLLNEPVITLAGVAIDFDLPEGVETLPLKPADEGRHATAPSELPGNLVHSWSYRWSSRFDRGPEPVKMYDPLCLRAGANLPAGDHPARLRIRGADYEGPWCDFTVRILPPLEPVVEPPKRILVGGTQYHDLRGEVAEAVLGTWHRMGANMLAQQTPPSDEFAAALRGTGLHLISSVWFWRNASQVMPRFLIGPPKPAEAQSVTPDGQPGHSWDCCPEYMLARGEWFEESVVATLRQELTGDDPLFEAWVTNWEPTSLYTRGCFDEKCRRAFAEFAGLDADAVLQMPGDELLKTHGEQWRAFRADQSARLVRLAWEVFDELEVERGEPIPHFLWTGSQQFRGGVNAGVGPNIGQADWLACWSYCGWMIDEGRWSCGNPFAAEDAPAIPLTAAHEHVARATEAIMREARAQARPGAGYLHGTLGCFGSFVTTPEEQALDVLASAVSRPWAIVPFAFPEAYDHRYVLAFADAMRVLGASEDLILDGEESAEAALEPVGAEAQPEGLWARKFSTGEETLYCLFNFDREHAASVRLRLDAPAQGTWALTSTVSTPRPSACASTPPLRARGRCTRRARSRSRRSQRRTCATASRCRSAPRVPGSSSWHADRRGGRGDRRACGPG